jgi:hypothetical protein
LAGIAAPASPGLLSGDVLQPLMPASEIETIIIANIRGISVQADPKFEDVRTYPSGPEIDAYCKIEIAI